MRWASGGKLAGASLLAAVVVLVLLLYGLPSAVLGAPVGVRGHLALPPRSFTPANVLRTGSPTSASAPTNVGVDAPCNGSANAEVQQAYDPAAAILFEDWIGCGGIGFTRSTDGGYSFAPAFAVPGSSGAGVFGSWDPAIALAPNGTVYVSFMADILSAHGVVGAPVVAWSWDHGRTFAGVSAANVPANTTFSDRDYLAVGPDGAVYLTWNLAPKAALVNIQCAPYASCYYTAGDFNGMFVASHDGGKTWSAPVPVNPDYPNGGVVAAPLLVEPNGSIDVLYEDYSIRNWTTHALGPGYNYFARSVDGGRTFGSPTPVSTLPLSPSVWWIDGWITRDAVGTLYASFDSQNGSADTAYVTVSRDDGASWGAPLRLNPDAGAAPHIMVTASGFGDGNAYIAFMTNNTTDAQWSTWLLVLSQYGQHLSSPMRASTQLGNPYNWTGDTIGVADLGQGRVDVAWSYGIGGGGGVVRSQVLEAPLELPASPPVPTATPGAAQVGLSWPPNPSTAVIVGTTVWWSTAGGPPVPVWVPGAFHAASLPNLTTGVPYAFALEPWDAFGPGPVGSPVSVTLSAWGAITGLVVEVMDLTVDGHSVQIQNGSYLANSTMGPHLVTADQVPTGGCPGATPAASPTFSRVVYAGWNQTVRLDIDLSPPPLHCPELPHSPTAPNLPPLLEAGIVTGFVVAVGALVWLVRRRLRRPMP